MTHGENSGGVVKRGIVKRLAEWLYPLYLSVFHPIRRNHWLIRKIFGVRLEGGETVSWDFTTLALKRVLRQRIRFRGAGGLSVLEIGVGQGALLSIFLARGPGVYADGVDVAPERVSSSVRVCRYNGLPLRIWQSDFFEHVEGRYDVIFWNAAYIPTGFGERHGLTARPDTGDQRAWDGGGDGAESIGRFLARAGQSLKPEGEILLGFNRFHVSPGRIMEGLPSAGLAAAGQISTLLNPSMVLILRIKGSDDKEDA